MTFPGIQPDPPLRLCWAQLRHFPNAADQCGETPATAVHAYGCDTDNCARVYDVSPEEARFQCVWCERWVGYCMGAADDMPALCDDCYCRVLEAPDVE